MWAIPEYVQCLDCGQQVVKACVATHKCDPVRKLNYEVEQAHPERFDGDWADYLESSAGSFAAWYAEHRR